MSGFLAHISDARDFLVRLILHQRDNLEDQARALDRKPEGALGRGGRGARSARGGLPGTVGDGGL